MFTGLIEETGKVRRISRKPGGIGLRIEGAKVLEDTKPGDSLSVDGVCLTVTKLRNEEFEVEVGEETLSRTKFSSLRSRDSVNLERALKPSDRLGGHLVQGHVDGVGRVRQRRRSKGQLLLHIAFPEKLSPYLVQKGSVALDGVSLTIASLKGSSLSVSLVPYTLENTTLGALRVGDLVNIEVDMVGKYLEKQGREGRLSAEILNPKY